MIISEESTRKPLLKPQATQNSPEAPNAPPPPYGAQEIPTHPQTPPRATGATARKRFFSALLVALLIWLLVTAFIRGIVQIAHSSKHKPHHPELVPNLPPPPGMSFSWCKGWTFTSGGHDHSSLPYTSTTSFDLPTWADALFVLSAGHHVGGNLQVRRASDPDTDVVRVDVEVGYYLEEIRDKAHVCLLNRGENERGVGIFTDDTWPPRHRRREDQLTFTITVHVPATPLNSFETNLPNFDQTVDFSHIYLHNLSLKSTNGDIKTSAMLNNGSIVSTNGNVRGDVTFENKLTIHTTNSAIDVTAHLINNPEQNQNTTLDARTTNGKIKADLHLDLNDREQHSTGGRFEVFTHTTNGPVETTVKEAPIDSWLSLSAKTTNGPAKVVAHPTFQGKFSAQTTSFQPNVQIISSKNDPAHQGRTRMLEMHRSGRVAEGLTYWSDGRSAPALKGSIQIRSTNSPVILTIN